MTIPASQQIPDPILSISIVTWQPDLEQFAAVLQHLAEAVRVLQAQFPGPVPITVIDNGHSKQALCALVDRLGTGLAVKVVAAGSNLGYGKAHNLAIASSTAGFHLIMNPDVLVDCHALLRGIVFLQSHAAVAAISPAAVSQAGNSLYLCKRYPPLFSLLLRAFAPRRVKQCFATRLAHYEHRAMVDGNSSDAVELISGCFMLCRTAMLKQAGAFNEVFFLYFEDFALSIELRKFGKLLYLPECRIVHFGGEAGKKGLRHVRYFLASALKFYRRYGWKLV